MAIFGVILFATIGRLEIAGFVTATDVAGRVLYGVASVLITIGVAGAEQQRTLRLGRWADIFGGMSYALYLFHIILLVILQIIFTATGAGAYLPGWLIVGGSMATTLATAALIHLGFEKPMIARIYALSVRKNRGTLPP